MAEEHSFATPAPAGLAALAVACFGFGAAMLGQVTVDGLPLLAVWLFGGFVVQLVVALIELKHKNVVGGNLFLFFCAYFMLVAALSMMTKFLMIKFGMKPSIIVEGWCWIAGAGYVTIITPAYAKSSSLMFALVIAFNFILWSLVGLDTGWFGDPAILKPIVGWVVVVCGFGALYMSGAVLVNTAYGKVIYPIPKPLVK